MASFDKFYPGLLRAEGGYVHNPLDPGGETWSGVARIYNPKWRGWPLIDVAKKRLGLTSPVPRDKYAALNKALAADAVLCAYLRAFYKASYWDVLSLDRLNNQSVAEQLADHGVNAGTSRPGRMLQYVLRQLGRTDIEEDGKLGPTTMAAANAVDQRKLFTTLAELRRDCYRYRAGKLTPGNPLLGLLGRLHISPNPTQAAFLPSWLGRVNAIEFSGEPVKNEL
jgi:lysozyme family protein